MIRVLTVQCGCSILQVSNWFGLLSPRHDQLLLRLATMNFYIIKNRIISILFLLTFNIQRSYHFLTTVIDVIVNVCCCLNGLTYLVKVYVVNICNRCLVDERHQQTAALSKT